MDDTTGRGPSRTPHLDAVMATHEGVWVRLALIDLVGDLHAGVLLSQAVYWTPRAEVKRNGATWIVKAYSEWWDEVRLTEKQARRAVQLLVESGLVETHVWKWNGTPKVHLRLVEDVVEDALSRLAQEGKSTCPVGQDDPPRGPRRSARQGKSFPHLPETTDENTPETRRGPWSEDVVRLCDLLADLMVANGCRRPTLNKSGWYEPMRLLVEKDGIEPERVERAIRWCQADDFWRGNIHSAKKLREKFDTLRQQARRTRPATVDGVRDAAAEYLGRRNGNGAGADVVEHVG